MGVIEFFQSADNTLSAKLLEVVYLIIGLVCIYAGVRNARDETNDKRVGTAIFWCILDVLFVIGRWIPSEWAGALVVALVISPILKQVGMGADKARPTEEEVHAGYEDLGAKIFVPAFSIGVVALVFALFTKISSLVGITVGVFVGMVILAAMRPKHNTAKVYLEDSRRMLDIVGPLIMLPTLLAILGATFTAAGVGDVISDIVGAVIPQGNMVVGIVVYCIGMAIFTMIMGNAFAAITVMTVGIGAPFVLPLGADPVVVGSLALTCGYCGTLMTPMAANFNIVPVAILEMDDEYGVIKKQVVPALVMLAFQIVLMVCLVAL
ncbi:MAG: DUF979 domain-containing protein [Coriobacteriaceae bacterium]|nr:DUF979 domain-containing protein [Coriobacteriaceae bacterium]